VNYKLVSVWILHHRHSHWNSNKRDILNLHA
jgi:hypothetical protein